MSQPWGQRPAVDTTSFSNKELYDDNSRMLQEQDDTLDSMYHSIKGTAKVAREIGEETEVHIGLLDDISASAARNDTKLRNATVAAKDVEISSSTKLLWGIIILLLVIMVILLIVAFGRK